ncbi:MAG: hypothetical protein ACFE8F_06395 [Promethearchaeota archaeon]
MAAISLLPTPLEAGYSSEPLLMVDCSLELRWKPQPRRSIASSLA